MDRKKNKAFTLIEILLVVVIIGILVAMVVPDLSGQGRKARISATRADIEANLATALDLYELENGQYPTTDQGLKALIRKPGSSPQAPNWDGPYLKKKRIPRDPWKRVYVYTSPGIYNSGEYDLSSYGPDGVESDDDISNWEDGDEF